MNINVGLLADYFFANVGLYIYSQQMINTTVAYFLWVAMIWRLLTAIWQ